MTETICKTTNRTVKFKNKKHSMTENQFQVQIWESKWWWITTENEQKDIYLINENKQRTFVQKRSEVEVYLRRLKKNKTEKYADYTAIIATKIKTY